MDQNKVMEGLLNVFTLEQLQIMADLCSRVKDRAIERRCDQSLQVDFNDKGYPRRFSGSDSVRVACPKSYSAE